MSEKKTNQINNMQIHDKNTQNQPYYNNLIRIKYLPLSFFC